MRKPRTKWTPQEKEALQSLLAEIRTLKKPPTKDMVHKAQNKFTALQSRDWQAIKYQSWATYLYERKKLEATKCKLLNL